MSTFLQLESSINIFLQSLGTWLTQPMAFFSFFGTEGFFLVAIPLIYWTIDAAMGMRLSVMLMLSGGLNCVLKFLFHSPRPYWINPAVKAFSGESSFGIPSGHSQTSLSVFGLFAALRKNKPGTILLMLLIILIGVSRLYLGVHFLTDVLAGWILGLVSIYLFIKFEHSVISWINKFDFKTQILIFFSFSILYLIIVFSVWFLNQNWIMPADWIANIQNSSYPQISSPYDPTDNITLAGLWFGMTAGFAWIYKKYGLNFSKGTYTQQAIKYGIGFIGVLIFWAGLGSIFPRLITFQAFSLRFLRYTLIGLWVTAIAPYIFISLNLSKVSSK
jgi:membrane-associated phospholipid phosphatase